MYEPGAFDSFIRFAGRGISWLSSDRRVAVVYAGAHTVLSMESRRPGLVIEFAAGTRVLVKVDERRDISVTEGATRRV
jgi:hypothetical protein